MYLLIKWSSGIMIVDEEWVELNLAHLQSLPDSVQTARIKGWSTNNLEPRLHDEVVEPHLQSGMNLNI